MKITIALLNKKGETPYPQYLVPVEQNKRKSDANFTVQPKRVHVRKRLGGLPQSNLQCNHMALLQPPHHRHNPLFP
jgi:hypothetical protein